MKKDSISLIGLSALGVNINDLIIKLGQLPVEYLGKYKWNTYYTEIYPILGLIRTKARIKHLKQ